MKTEISINGRSQSCVISNSVDSSNTASAFADYLDNLTYLKVRERKYLYPQAIVKCYTIRGLFTIEKLQSDIEQFNNQYNQHHE